MSDITGRDKVGRDVVGADSVGGDSISAGRDSTSAGRDVHNYAAALDQVIAVLNARYDDLVERMDVLHQRIAHLEALEETYINDRRVMTRLIGSMGVESVSIRDVQALLEEQVRADRADRDARRRFLDRAMYAILTLSAVQAAMTIYQAIQGRIYDRGTDHAAAD